MSAAEPMVILPALSAVEGSEQSETKDLRIFHRPSLRVTRQGLTISVIPVLPSVMLRRQTLPGAPLHELAPCVSKGANPRSPAHPGNSG